MQPPRTALAVLAALLALPGVDEARAQDVQLGGFLFAEATHRDARDTPVNPGDLFDLSSDVLETAVLVEAEAAGLKLRMRAEAVGRGDDWPGRTRVRLQELSYQRRVGERWSVSIGKQERSWDTGLAFRPLGFFRSRPDLRDIFDAEGRQEGLPLVSATYVGDQFIVEAVASDDVFGDIENGIEARQWAARISRQFGKVDTSLVVRQAAGQRPGVGGSASYAAGAVELHVDAYVGPRGRRRVHRGLLGEGADGMAVELYETDPFLIDRGGRGTVLNSVVGVTWAPSRENSIGLEYIHQGNGFSDWQWSGYLDLVDSHRAALETPSRGPAIANLAYDLDVLRGTVRRDYLSLRGATSWKKLSLSATAFIGLADASALLNGSVVRQLGRRASAVLTVSGFMGRDDAEFGLIPFGTIVSLSLRRSF